MRGGQLLLGCHASWSTYCAPDPPAHGSASSKEQLHNRLKNILYACYTGVKKLAALQSWET